MTPDTTAAKSEPDDAPRFCVGCGARFGELHRACPRCGELGWTSTPPIDMGTSGSLGEFVPDTTSVDWCVTPGCQHMPAMGHDYCCCCEDRGTTTHGDR